MCLVNAIVYQKVILLFIFIKQASTQSELIFNTETSGIDFSI